MAVQSSVSASVPCICMCGAMSFVRIHLDSETFFSQFLTPHTQSRQGGVMGGWVAAYALDSLAERRGAAGRGRVHSKHTQLPKR